MKEYDFVIKERMGHASIRITYDIYEHLFPTRQHEHANRLENLLQGELTMNKTVSDYWDTFLKETGRDKNTKYFEAFYFGSTEKMATELLALVLSGEKTATASALQEYINNDDKQPQVNDLSIVTDWEGNPKCIIQTTDVLNIKFKDVTYEICKREGEDENLESWQNNHIKFLNDVGAENGYTFSWNMDIIFEDFKVIY